MKIAEWLVSIALRVVFGIVGIYLVNTAFVFLGRNILVGLNPCTVGCVGILGMPGFAMLYAVAVLELL